MASAVAEIPPNTIGFEWTSEAFEQDIQNAQRIAQRLETELPKPDRSKGDHNNILEVGGDVVGGLYKVNTVAQQYGFVCNGNEILSMLQTQLQALPEEVASDPTMCQRVVEWLTEFCNTHMKPFYAKCSSMSSINEKDLLTCAAENPRKALEDTINHISDGQIKYLERWSAIYTMTSFGSMVLTCWNCVNKMNEIANIKIEGKNLDELAADLCFIRDRLEETWNFTSRVIDGFSNQGVMPDTNAMYQVSLQYQEIRNDLVHCINKLEKMESTVSSEANNSWHSTIQSLFTSGVSFAWSAVSSTSVAYTALSPVFKACTWAPGGFYLISSGFHFKTYKECKKKLDQIRKELANGKEIQNQLESTIQKYKQRLLEMRILQEQERQRGGRYGSAIQC